MADLGVVLAAALVPEAVPLAALAVVLLEVAEAVAAGDDQKSRFGTFG